MLKLAIFSLLVCTIFVITSAANNQYCSADLCSKGKHIACGNNGDFKSRCPSNTRMVSLEPYKKKILGLHNSKRNLIASGSLPGYKPAQRMATMQWDNELAAMAALNVKQCKMRHDKCRNTPRFPKSGQNLAIISYTGPESNRSDSELIENRINAWWNEYEDCNMKIINKYPEKYTGPKIGHFTVFVVDKNDRVGCAAVRFTKRRKHTFLIACNYASTNIKSKPIYISGNAASGCKTGRSSKYSSLCSKKEIY